MGTITRDALIGRWTHSHEDDTADTRVYRPASYPFPPARGRASVELKTDGTMIDFGIGPADRPAGKDGRWELTPDGRLVLRTAGGRERTLHVVSVTDDRLVTRR